MSQDFYYKNTPLPHAPFYVWGIVNLTPDSFHDGGKHFDTQQATVNKLKKNTQSIETDKITLNNTAGIQHAQQLLREGAAILDIGGASSRPNAKNVPAHEEWQRIKNTLLQLVELRTSLTENRFPLSPILETQAPTRFPKGIIPFGGEFERQSLSTNNSPLPLSTNNSPLPLSPPIISIDTWRADVAKNALLAGADIINDISAFNWEPKLLDIVAEHKAGYVLMHCQGTPESMQTAPTYHNIVDEVMRFFEKKMNKLIQKGLPENHIILDIGIGFGKNLEHNLTLLREVERFHCFKRPLLLGISHKSFFGHLLGIDSDKRTTVTQVCTALMAQKNIIHHRVHDVLETVQSLRLQYALKENFLHSI